MTTILKLLNIYEDIELFNLWAEASPSFATAVQNLRVSSYKGLRVKLREYLVAAALENLIDAAPSEEKLQMQLLIKSVTLDKTKTSAYSVRGCSRGVQEIIEAFIKNPEDVIGSARMILDLNLTQTNWRIQRKGVC